MVGVDLDDVDPGVVGHEAALQRGRDRAVLRRDHVCARRPGGREALLATELDRGHERGERLRADALRRPRRLLGRALAIERLGHQQARDRQQRPVQALDRQRAVSMSNAAGPVTNAASGLSVGRGTIWRSASTSRTSESVSSLRLSTVSSVMDTGVSDENVDSPVSERCSCPGSPHATPPGAGTATRSGRAGVPQIVSTSWLTRPACSWIAPSLVTATTEVDQCPSGKVRLSSSCTCVDSAPRARNVSLSSAALLWSLGCNQPSPTARTSHVAITTQRDRRPTTPRLIDPSIATKVSTLDPTKTHTGPITWHSGQEEESLKPRMRRMKLRVAGALVLAVVTLAGCGGDKAAEAPGSTAGKVVQGESETGMKLKVESFVPPASDPVLKKLDAYRAAAGYPAVDYHRVTATGLIPDRLRVITFASNADDIPAGKGVEARFGWLRRLLRVGADQEGVDRHLRSAPRIALQGQAGQRRGRSTGARASSTTW